MFLILTYPSFSINILDLIISWGEGNDVDGYQTVAWPAGSVEDGVVVFMLGGTLYTDPLLIEEKCFFGNIFSSTS